MLSDGNPYAAPTDAPAPLTVGVRSLALPFVAWFVAASTVGGTLHAWSVCSALAIFGSQARTAGIVAIGALRHGGGALVASSLAVAMVVACHRVRQPLRQLHPPRLGLAFLVAPPMAVLGALLITMPALLIMGPAYGVAPAECWTSVTELVVPQDAVPGIVVASGASVLVATAARTALPRPRVRRMHVVLKVIAGLIVARIAAFMVSTLVELGLLIVQGTIARHK